MKCVELQSSSSYAVVQISGRRRADRRGEESSMIGARDGRSKSWQAEALHVSETDVENYKKITHSFQGSRGCFTLVEMYSGYFRDLKRPSHNSPAQ